MVIITTITYLNHFDNSFHFDDSHTITQNPNVRSIKNIPLFFIDGTTSSSLPQNQTYRPIVTSSLAFDYWLGNGYDLFYFHFITFVLFLLQGILIYFFSYKILELSTETTPNFYVASGITLWYMLHPVMAETVNYIIARSDLQSTFFVIIAFILYQYWPPAKKYHLYLLAIIIGILAKPIAIMFPVLFFCYLLLFEYKMSFPELFSKKSIYKSITVLKRTIPSVLICSLLYIFIDKMTPEAYTTGSSQVYNYLITQPYVISYYFGSSLFPIHLSADTDWSVLQTIWSYKFFLGLSLMILLISIAFFCSKKKIYRPISFGISWFFITLVPTSSIIPLAEVMNDHRMFLPYIGLIISLGHSIGLFIEFINKKYQLKKIYISIGIASLLLLYGFGTYQRNEVWNNDETLWKDVTIKSPKNGRGLMNYGITLMAKGEYNSAEKYFLKALEITPFYHTLFINLGILYNAKENNIKAEEYFKKAVKHGENFSNSWFYYGKFLSENSRKNEAIDNLEIAMKLSPYHMGTKYLLMENYLKLEDWDRLQKTASKTLKIYKNDKRAQQFLLASIEKIDQLQIEEREIETNATSEKYINLSVKYYQKKKYIKCIEAAKKAIKLNPNSDIAYNNICSAYNLIGNYSEAIVACNKALKLNHNFDLAKNNLNEVTARKKKTENLISLVAKNPNEGNYLNLGLLYYNYGLFEKCIEISKEGIKKHPNSDKLYNNVCAAFNSLKIWQKGIEYGEKGLAINPKNQLLRNNYNLAFENKN